MEKIDSIEIEGLIYYCRIDFLKVYNIKSHRTLYQMLERKTAVKTKFLGKTIYAKVGQNAK